MEPLICQRSNFRIYHPIHKVKLAFKYLAKFFEAFLPQPFTQKENVFSFKL